MKELWHKKDMLPNFCNCCNGYWLLQLENFWSSPLCRKYPILVLYLYSIITITFIYIYLNPFNIKL